MSLIDTLAFVRTQQQDAVGSRVTLESASRRFAEDADATRMTWADEAARGVFTRHVDPYRLMLDTAMRMLASAEQAQTAALTFTQQALEAAELALGQADAAARNSADVCDQASYALLRAREAQAGGDQVETQIASIRAALAGLGQ